MKHQEVMLVFPIRTLGLVLAVTEMDVTSR